MSEISVDAVVAQGSMNKLEAKCAVGTDGCSKSIGMLALMPDGRIWCAHFDCSLPGMDNKEWLMIQKDTYSLLRNVLIAQPTALQACTSAPLSQSTGAIWAGIEQFFAGARIDTRAEGVYVNAKGVIACLKTTQKLKGKKASPNVLATIPMPVHG